MDIDKKQFQKDIGERIKVLRRRARLSQAKLALKCGKDKQQIGRIEKGHVNPTAYTLIQIAQALDVSIKDLFDFGK